MCLRVSRQVANHNLFRHFNATVEVYKVVSRAHYKLWSPYQGQSFEYVPGMLTSNRRSGTSLGARETYNQYCSDPAIYEGIHVCLTLEEAKRIKSEIPSCKRPSIIRLTAKFSDLVGVGNFCNFAPNTGAEEEAVFHRVYLSEKDYKRGLKGSL